MNTWNSNFCICKYTIHTDCTWTQVGANSQLTFVFFIHYVYIIVFIFSIIWTIYSSPMSPDNQGSTV